MLHLLSRENVYDTALMTSLTLVDNVKDMIYF